MIREPPVIAPGRAVQGGRPETRPLKPGSPPSHEMRRARCAIATQITSAVTAVATTVPQMTSPIGAPFAGALEAANAGPADTRLPSTVPVKSMPSRFIACPPVASSPVALFVSLAIDIATSSLNVARIDETLNLAIDPVTEAAGRRPPGCALRPAALGRAVLGVDLSHARADEALARHELALEPLELSLAPAHQLQLGPDVRERLGQKPPALGQVLRRPELPPELRAGRLGRHQLAELVEAEIEQVPQPPDLAQPLDVRVRVAPALALLAILRGGEQSDLLVVANRARRGPGQLRQLAYAEAAIPHVRRRWAGRMSETSAPRADTHARHHSATCMFWMNGSSLPAASPLASPEKILNSTAFGTAAVTTASTNAIEITAPVFWSITRAPAATPRRALGTTPIMAAVFGLLNMPEPTPTTNSHSPLCQ